MYFNFLQFLKQLPFSRLLLPFIAGIVLSLYFSIDIKFAIMLFVSISILFALSVFYIFQRNKFSFRWLPGAAINILLILGGILIVQANKTERIKHYNTIVKGEAVISEPVKENEKTYKSILKDVTYSLNDTIFRAPSNILVYFSKENLKTKPNYGDKILFTGRIQKIKNAGNPHEFDYKQYLNRKGVSGQIFLKYGTWHHIDKNKANFIFEYAYKTRHQLEQVYQKFGISGKELSVLKALTLGDKSDIDDEIRQAYVVSGSMHILAVSGLHVGIIFMLFNFLLKFLDKLKTQKRNYGKSIKAVLLLCIIWSFAVLSGLSPSIRRAALMFSFIIIAQALNRHVNIYNSISASAFILLIINPYQITEIGFQLSYSAVLGIVLFQPKLVALFTIKNKILYYFWSLTSVSIAAQISTAPITLYYFHIFPSYFFLSNLIVIPAATLILTTAFTLLISSPVPYFSSAVAFLLNHLLKILNLSVSFIESLPYSAIDNISFNAADLIFAFSGIVTLSVFFILKKVRALHIFMILLIIRISIGGFERLANNADKLVIYNINKYTAIDVISKKGNYFLSRPAIFKTKHINYGIRSNRLYMKQKDFQFIPIDTSKFASSCIQKNGIYTAIGNKTFLFFNRKHKLLPSTKIIADYVVLSDNVALDLEELKNLVDFDTLIIDSSNNYYRLKKWKKACRHLHIKFISVKDTGAFSIEL